MSRPPSSWRRRPGPRPWTDEEDAEIINATGCGLSVDYLHIEGRTFGELMERRLELIEAGRVQRARAI